MRVTTVEGELQGVAPILFNKFVDPSALDPDGRKGGRRLTQEAVEAEAPLKAYRGPDGVLIFPAWNLKRSLIDGAALLGLKVGKRSAVPFIKGGVFIDSDPSFGTSAPDGLPIHSCVGRIPPKTGAAAIIRRPMLDVGWALTFTMRLLDTAPPVRDVRAALDQAGLLAGLGAWRPEYGRYIVSRWEVVPPD